MKFTDIGKRAKATKIAVIVTDDREEQWVYTGGAAYKLEGLPRMTAEDFLRLVGVSEEKLEKFYKEENEGLARLLSGDGGEDIELTSDMAGIAIETDGYYLMPFYTGFGVIWTNVQNMEPIIKGETSYIRFFLRRHLKGFMIIVKEGFNTIAVISEWKMTEKLLEQVGLLYQQCRMRGVETEEREVEKNMKYEVCEKCGAHLDHGEKCDCEE